MDFEDLKSVITVAKEYVYTLHIRQLLSHLDLVILFNLLPKLDHLDLSYGYVLCHNFISFK